MRSTPAVAKPLQPAGSAILDGFPRILGGVPAYPGLLHPERCPKLYTPQPSFPSQRLINAKQCQLSNAQTISQASCHT
jgi:hypothetical protein